LSLLLSGEEGFTPPSTADFNLPPVFGDNPYTTKPVFLVFLSVIVVSAFFIASSRKALIMPTKLQFAGAEGNNVKVLNTQMLSKGNYLVSIYTDELIKTIPIIKQ
jgi:hypothetical protein